MKSRLEVLIDLLHGEGEATLATHSRSMPGYPFATAVAIAVDERHRPLLLISQLAEHTRNLAADARASLLMARSLGGGEMARVTLVGEVRPLGPEPGLVQRYVRYQPAAERFLQLGDFRLHRLEPRRILVVGGFAQAAWLDGSRLTAAASIGLEEETALLDAAGPKLPPGVSLLGVDAYGADLVEQGRRRRVAFETAPVAADEVLATLLAG